MSLIKPTRPNFNRRDLLRMAAMAPAFAMPASARAMLGAPTDGNPAHFSFTLGAARITIVSDGYFTLPFGGQAMNAPEEDKLAFMAAHYIDPTMGYSHTNHMYIELDEAKVLVDVGSGNRWFDTTGRLMENLEVAGIDPMGITHVAITHAHPDHIWGIRDDFDEPIIPDAEYLIGAAEHAHWMQDGLVDRVAPEDQQFVLGAVNSITAEGVDWTLASNDHEIAPGIRMIDTPGHTPGHMSVMVESEGRQILALGDCLTHAILNFAHPEWYSARDADGAQTVATRNHLLDQAATDRIAVLGYHFPFPGVGHVARDGDAYQFIPALWQF